MIPKLNLPKMSPVPYFEEVPHMMSLLFRYSCTYYVGVSATCQAMPSEANSRFSLLAASGCTMELSIPYVFDWHTQKVVARLDHQEFTQ